MNFNTQRFTVFFKDLKFKHYSHKGTSIFFFDPESDTIDWAENRTISPKFWYYKSTKSDFKNNIFIKNDGVILFMYIIKESSEGSICWNKFTDNLRHLFNYLIPEIYNKLNYDNGIKTKLEIKLNSELKIKHNNNKELNINTSKEEILQDFEYTYSSIRDLSERVERIRKDLCISFLRRINR
ncbi:MAG: hypothetical protein GF316_00290 [Candidatus Lokiarchaeota archaeon]|nr:hypothetical protein [Candidatus Lokiarchaeota archaeon]